MTVYLESPHGEIAIAEYNRFLGEPGVTIRRAGTGRKIHMTETEALAVIDAVADHIEQRMLKASQVKPGPPKPQTRKDTTP